MAESHSPESKGKIGILPTGPLLAPCAAPPAMSSTTGFDYVLALFLLHAVKFVVHDLLKPIQNIIISILV